MRIVDRPMCRPMRCAVLPYVGQTHQGTRWIDTGSELDGFDNHVYVSELAALEMGCMFGMVTAGDHKAIRLELEAAQARIEELETELADQDAVLEAIDTLESANFQARKKPGRKKTQEPVSA